MKEIQKACIGFLHVDAVCRMYAYSSMFAGREPQEMIILGRSDFMLISGDVPSKIIPDTEQE